MKENTVYRVNQIRLPVTADEADAQVHAIRKLGIERQFVRDVKVSRRSVDSRKDRAVLVYSVDITVSEESVKVQSDPDIIRIKELRYRFPVKGSGEEIVVAGSGPAGLFASFVLAENGFRPLLIERGESIEHRKKTVHSFWETGVLNPESNIQFGEGGAGTFSDGKLNSGIKDRYGRRQKILETLVSFGAPESILIDAKPHIGTDYLETAVAGIRNRIIELGGEVRFNTKLTGVLAEPNLSEITVNGQERIRAENLILAPGHSARDTFKMLELAGLKMLQKGFSLGVRIEHLQETINRSQYGVNYSSRLPEADYKLSHRTAAGTGVYTFCMCPGGYVVNAASEEGMCVTNGMSYYKRAGINANAAVLVNISPEDFGSCNVLAGIELQRELERKAYELGGGDYSLPVQRLEDFIKGQPSGSTGAIRPQIKGRYRMSDLSGLFPEKIREALIEGILAFGKKIEGFDSPDALLVAVESRSSSPVRIVRDDSGASSIPGIYPCGEGAGYAGGILSAAVDGIKAAEAAAAAVHRN